MKFALIISLMIFINRKHNKVKKKTGRWMTNKQKRGDVSEFAFFFLSRGSPFCFLSSWHFVLFPPCIIDIVYDEFWVEPISFFAPDVTDSALRLARTLPIQRWSIGIARLTMHSIGDKNKELMWKTSRVPVSPPIIDLTDKRVYSFSLFIWFEHACHFSLLADDFMK